MDVSAAQLKQLLAAKDIAIAVKAGGRVWKGDVPQTFEMPAKKEMADCEGFAEDFLKGGTDLLVYAFKSQGEYVVTICSRMASSRRLATTLLPRSR